ncbi:hypothetical protein [Collimonas sp.]|jgi:hypothetical protein|uniref:hypothetical protein n=1 Tax=Collimonas sp. TaxID=1963772 RepID=UPI002CF5F426|nr:hypothetical protein [Collimonas sp.]HWX01560.1 hypothetical protein [Collimonas sp.]
MQIILSSGVALHGDLLLSACLHSDLAPVPMTLEAIVRASDETIAALKQGEKISLASEGYEFRIVQVKRNKASPNVQGDDMVAVLHIVALFEPCHQIAFRRKTAVIKEGATLGSIYGACGARVKINADYSIARFACLAGGVPSYEIAKVLQEEGGAIYTDGREVTFTRLQDIFKQEPILSLEYDTTENIESGFMERHEVPSFFSIDAAGAFVYGNSSKVRVIGYQPRTDVRVLWNMTRTLVQKKIMTTDYLPAANAGRAIEIERVKYAIITAAHAFEGGSDGGDSRMYTKFWLGAMEE